LKKWLQLNYQAISERRANAKFKNCEVLNSYKLLQDGKYAWYEVILVDRESPVVKKDPQLKGIAKQTKRTEHGLTSAGRKSRGLRSKGRGAEKIRPSLRAKQRRH